MPKIPIRRLFLLSCLFLAACSGPEAKKQKFYSKGKELFEKGNLVKARLELKNAIQIDPKFAPAYELCGMMDLKEGNLKGAFGNFSKAAQLDPASRNAQYQLGKIFLAVRQPDKALEKAEALLKQDPGYPDALLLKGAVLVARRDSGARSYLEGVIARGVRKPDGYLLLASTCQVAGDLKGAEGTLRSGIEANPGSVELPMALVTLLAQSGRGQEVEPLLTKLCTLEPKNVNHSLNLASFYLAQKKEPQAVEQLKRVIEADPKDEERRLRVAQFYLSHNRAGEAERELREGISLLPKSYPLRLALAGLQVQTGQDAQGIATLKESLSLGKDADPGVIQAKTALARIHLQRSELEQATTYVDQVLKESPKNVDACFIRGSILLQKHDGLNAVNAFRTVVSEKPQFIDGYIHLAEAYLLQKENNLALDTLKNAQKLDPQSREAQIALSRYYLSQKDVASARAVLEKLLSKNPKDLEARAELGDVLAAAGEAGKAEAEYARVKSLAPQIPLGYLKSGAFYLRQGKKARALAEFEKAYALNKESWLLANDLAFMIADTSTDPKELDRALALAEKARSLNPQALNVVDTLGWLHYKRGESQKAVELLQQVQAKRPEAPEANYHLGMALYQAGKHQEAKAMLNKSLAGRGTFPGREEAARIVAKI